MPLHAQVSEQIRARIVAGEWPPHYRLRSEPELAAEFGISRGTLRRALATLIRDGLLVQVRGRGTYVTSTAIEPSIAQKLTTLAEDFARQGVEASTEVRASEVISAPSPVAALLDLRPGKPVLRLERLRSTSAGPVAWLVNYVRVDLAPGLERLDLVNRSLFGVLENEYGLIHGQQPLHDQRSGSRRRVLAGREHPLPDERCLERGDCVGFRVRGEVFWRMSVPGAHELAVTHDGKHAYVSRRTVNRLALINLEDHTFEDLLALGLPDSLELSANETVDRRPSHHAGTARRRRYVDAGYQPSRSECPVRRRRSEPTSGHHRADATRLRHSKAGRPRASRSSIILRGIKLSRGSATRTGRTESTTVVRDGS